jgi:hypothetical protein
MVVGWVWALASEASIVIDSSENKRLLFLFSDDSSFCVITSPRPLHVESAAHIPSLHKLQAEEGGSASTELRCTISARADRKTKCDGSTPCARCAEKDLDCTYAGDGRKRLVSSKRPHP